MIVACAASIAAPFHTFLFAYAFLGPLHYLTEVSWLHDRGYFAPRVSARRAWLALVLVTTLVMAFGFISSELLHRDVPPVYEIGLFLLVFAGAAIVLYVQHPVNGIVLGLIVAGAVAMFAGSPAYGIGAYLLMTLVHVFVFTGFFIAFGALKSRSRSGIISLAVFVACALATILLDTPFRAPDAGLRAVYATFEQLNGVVLQLAGRSHVSVYDSAAIHVMRFIAFAYLYHYLNWFSKTSVIGWHHVPRRRAIAIVVAWVAGIALYFVNYKAGFAVFYVLSVVHVMLEFPLNYASFVGLVRTLRPATIARSR
jgi:hypothetical protein